MQLKHLKRLDGHQNKNNLTNIPREMRYSSGSWQWGQSNLFRFGNTVASSGASEASSIAIELMTAYNSNDIGFNQLIIRHIKYKPISVRKQ